MSEQDDELLQLALSGELPRDAPELSALFARRPELARRLDELAALASELDAAADDETRAISRARAETTERDRRTVAEALRRARKGPTPVGVFRRTWWPLAAAAALVAIAALAVWFRGGDPLPDPTFLSTGELRVLAPREQVESWGEILWEGELPRAGAFVVTLEGESSTDPAGKVIITSPRCTTKRWRPTDEQLAGLPDRIRVTVAVLDGTGRELSSASAEAWRSP